MRQPNVWHAPERTSRPPRSATLTRGFIGFFGISAMLAMGCGSGTGASESAEASGATEAASAEAPSGPRRRVVAVVPKGTTHVFWNAVHAGANKAAEELGVDILWQGPVREDDRAAQVRVVEDVISRQVDALVLAPLDDTALVPVAREASAQNIPVVIFDSDIRWSGRVSFVATDNHRAGALAAERLAGLLGGRGQVLMMRYQQGSASTQEREAGFLEGIARYPNVLLVSSNQFGGATTETAYGTAESLLVRYPAIDGVFTPNESTTFGMLRALRDANKAGAVKFVGFDSSEGLLAALREEHIHGLLVQNPFRMGELSVQAAVAQLDGRPVEARVDTGATMVTPQNMGDEAVRALLEPDLARYLRAGR